MDDGAISDEDLLAAWRGGDKRAGAALLTRHHASVARFFIHKLGADSDDLVQATFLGLLEGIDRFRGEASFRTLLFAIARNKLYRHLRDLTRDRKRFDPVVTSIAAIGLTPSSALAARDQSKLLLEALRALPLDTQMMLELHYWEKLRIADIAAILDMPEGTVKIRMHRGRRQLEDEMEKLAVSKDQLQTTLNGLSKWAARLREEIGEREDS